MGFVEEVNENLSTETRRESVKLHAQYPWTTGCKCQPHEHIEIPYTDLPMLVKHLVKIMHQHCEMDKQQ